MFKILKIFFITLIVCSTVFLVTPSNAQIGLPEDFPFDINSLPINLPELEDYTTISLLPEHPGPNQSVTASLLLNLTDLNKAEISWFLNGELQESGVGDKSFNFKTGPTGSVTRVSVLIDTFEGETAEKEIVIRPAEVDILWNANTYTPPFYKGKALFTNQSEITLTAIPNFFNSGGNRINPKNLVYEWYRGNSKLKDYSGFGKDTLSLKGGVLFKSLDVKVEVRTLDDSMVAEKNITISPENPEALIYQNHPLYGILLNRTLDKVTLKDREITLSAIPYFFSALTKNDTGLEYSWNQNNRSISGQDQPNEIILRQVNESQTGIVSLGLNIRDRDNSFSTDNKNIQISIEN